MDIQKNYLSLLLFARRPNYLSGLLPLCLFLGYFATTYAQAGSVRSTINISGTVVGSCVIDVNMSITKDQAELLKKTSDNLQRLIKVVCGSPEPWMPKIPRQTSEQENTIYLTINF
jgi:hypothetical protein